MTNLLPVKNSSDEKIFLLTLSLILCIPITAQYAIRKELGGGTEVLKFTAYHITESGEYLFIMNANNSKRINGANGSISTGFELLAGDQYQAREMMDGWAELL